MSEVWKNLDDVRASLSSVSVYQSSNMDLDVPEPSAPQLYIAPTAYCPVEPHESMGRGRYRIEQKKKDQLRLRLQLIEEFHRIPELQNGFSNEFIEAEFCQEYEPSHTTEDCPDEPRFPEKPPKSSPKPTTSHESPQTTLQPTKDRRCRNALILNLLKQRSQPLDQPCHVNMGVSPFAVRDALNQYLDEKDS